MPVILRIRGYRIWFYEADLDEPPHVHIGKDGKEAKFWVDPITPAQNGRFRTHELHEIGVILAENCAFIMEAWRKEERKRASR